MIAFWLLRLLFWFLACYWVSSCLSVCFSCLIYVCDVVSCLISLLGIAYAICLCVWQVCFCMVAFVCLCVAYYLICRCFVCVFWYCVIASCYWCLLFSFVYYTLNDWIFMVWLGLWWLRFWLIDSLYWFVLDVCVLCFVTSLGLHLLSYCFLVKLLV